MGFEVYFRSTQPVDKPVTDAIIDAADAANEGRTWLSCEPVYIFNREDGHLEGGSKPNFRPHPDDAASAASEGLPDGTVRDMLDILCQLSRDHGVDWEISHDHSDGPIGYIEGGVCDDEVLAQIEAFADLSGFFLEELLAESENQPGGLPEPAGGGTDEDSDEDDEDGPTILSFRPKGE
jgi:hypothetical protein